MPPDRAALLPFVLAGDRLIAPWPKGRASPADLMRLDAVLDQAASLARLGELPHEPTWFWPDRPTQPVANPGDRWLQHWSLDRAIYAAM